MKMRELTDVHAVVIHHVELFLARVVVDEDDARMRDPRLAGQLEGDLVRHEVREPARILPGPRSLFSPEDFPGRHVIDPALHARVRTVRLDGSADDHLRAQPAPGDGIQF